MESATVFTVGGFRVGKSGQGVDQFDAGHRGGVDHICASTGALAPWVAKLIRGEVGASHG